MGLSGRKVKQRIPQDPRNLTWADDAARFGSNYLSKFGWDASKGLGAGGDGMTSHIKVSHKLDMLGIGAGHQKDPNGIAWKQNKDFENLLRRLNENLAVEQAAASENKAGDENAEKDAEDVGEAEKKKEKKNKRKHKDDDGEGGSEDKKKKRKKEKREQISEAMDVDQTETTVSLKVDAVVEEKVVATEVKRPVVPRHRAHRARAIAAKNISSKSTAHISEILGVAPTDSSSQYTSKDGHQGKLTSLTEDEDTSGLEIEKITTSTKSVADYFKEKLQARAGIKKEDSSATPSSNSSTEDNDAYDMPRMGLGSSRIRTEIYAEVKVEEETQRLGLSKFSSLMSSSFLASTSFIPPTYVKTEDADAGIAHLSEAESEPKKKEKTKKKEKVKDDEVSDKEDEEEKTKKKSKKDKKGKGKVSDSELDEEKPEKKEKTKKDKKSKSEKVSKLENAAEAENADADNSSTKKRKKKEGKEKASDIGGRPIERPSSRP